MHHDHVPDHLEGDRRVTSRLVHLDDVDEFKVADGDPDIRGWDVRTADGRKIGHVEDLIVDTGLMKVRYIEAKLDRDIATTDDDRHVLIPIGTARLDDERDDVYLSTNVVDPHQLPAYERNELSRDYEVSLRNRYSGATETSAVSSPDDFYSHDLYDDNRFFGERRKGRENSSYFSPIDRSTNLQDEQTPHPGSDRISDRRDQY